MGIRQIHVLDRIWLTASLTNFFDLVVTRMAQSQETSYNRNMFENIVLNPSWYLYDSVWRFIASVAILLFGFIFARRITKGVRQAVSRVAEKRQLHDSPLGVVVEPAVALRGSGIFSTVVFSSIMFLFIAWAGEVLGITFFASIVAMIVSFMPSLFSALIVFIFGVLLAGVAERVVKQQFRRVSPSRAVLAGTAASSFTLIMFVMIALSELGIASEFILILFAGFIFSIALAAGIGLGFGAKEIIADSLENMVKEETQVRQRSKEKKYSDN